MLERLIAIANELDELGEHEAADQLDKKLVDFKASPLELAIALGLVPPQTVAEGQEGDFEEGWVCIYDTYPTENGHGGVTLGPCDAQSDADLIDAESGPDGWRFFQTNEAGGDTERKEVSRPDWFSKGPFKADAYPRVQDDIYLDELLKERGYQHAPIEES